MSCLDVKVDEDEVGFSKRLAQHHVLVSWVRQDVELYAHDII
jgi:hypothetical protein